MFVPRAVRLKGVKERQRTAEPGSKSKPLADAKNDAAPSTQPPGQSAALRIKSPAAAPESHVAAKAAAPEFLGLLICGIELIFSDYAHQDKDRANWLETHYSDFWTKDKSKKFLCADKFIHLSHIMDHPNISSLKPLPTQPVLRQALQEHPSPFLETVDDGYWVRRRPSTYPMAFVPENSFDVFDDHGLSFWDQRTIYVEPHLRDLCKTPAKVAHWLKEHGGMRAKWLPVQAVNTLYNGCAFVVLSGNVTHEGTWLKWREAQKPEFWIVHTKVEYEKRAREYVELMAKEQEERSRKEIPERSRKQKPERTRKGQDRARIEEKKPEEERVGTERKQHGTLQGENPDVPTVIPGNDNGESPNPNKRSLPADFEEQSHPTENERTTDVDETAQLQPPSKKSKRNKRSNRRQTTTTKVPPTTEPLNYE